MICCLSLLGVCFLLGAVLAVALAVLLLLASAVTLPSVARALVVAETGALGPASLARSSSARFTATASTTAAAAGAAAAPCFPRPRLEVQAVLHLQIGSCVHAHRVLLFFRSHVERQK